MALSFIGKPISLISHSDVRYRGILAGIDPAASTIQLSNVFSMGTETRKPPAEYIPPVQEPYQYIIFRASEVKDLAVDEPVPPPQPHRSVHDDPAVLGASAPAPAPYGAYPPGFQPPAPAQQPPQPPPPQQYAQAAAAAAGRPGPGPGPAPDAQPRRGGPNNTGSIHTAAASLETVERALGDLRVQNGGGGGAPRGGGRGGRRGHGSGGAHEKTEIRVPTTDFDFQGSNARFDKAALGPKKSPVADEERAPDDKPAEVVDSNDAVGKADGAKKDDGAYNPTRSFFDSLSSSTQGPDGPPGGGGRGGRRGGGRNRREEERERNVATFGEPGGVGLMGPGAYVGGWGGHGRRGGRGPRRGGAAVAGR
ncbi:hypothetical protein CONPUDRAFT_134604 [Coniophora puteana RWD-64-598 SS2]|uniref:TFG box profile domain-containing protein n=1 Tax=Coniophora puteana (strain RWD-64-598) TaxID=741705 RepID=A0A5M3MZS3_CONPW|nr:uncharacterized protein CONPUDRAFT_134604 [Coniophora puteana RWD-64-598 SS2]EIW84629.1 hypothetical protein CONPUDRAFT_134604 [Coniophora puteana RWD-64-598 SS2]